MASSPTADILYHLENGTLDLEGYVPWGSNYTFVCTMHCGTEVMQAVYKPRRGERPLWDFAAGTLCQRERAAYLVSEALDWGVVPPTILRDGPHGWGSVQAYIDHDPNENYFTFKESYFEQLRPIALLDLIINNADRKGGHVICDLDGRLWAIDHGITFHDEPKLRTVIWDFAGETINSSNLNHIQQFDAALKNDEDLHRQLSELLSGREMAALKKRVQNLIHYSQFPQPGPGRPYPWPMV